MHGKDLKGFVLFTRYAHKKNEFRKHENLMTKKQDKLFLRGTGNILKSKHVNVNTSTYLASMMYNRMLEKEEE